MSTRKNPKPWQPLQRGSLRLTFTNPEQLAYAQKITADCEVFVNDRYTVIVRRQDGPIGQLVHMSIHDHNRTSRHDWREFQKIKNDIIGPEAEAFELYPAESRLVDTSNEYHLWAFVGQKLDCIGWTERLVSQEGVMNGAKQRRWAEGDEPPDLVVIDEEYLRKHREADVESKEQSVPLEDGTQVRGLPVPQ